MGMTPEELKEIRSRWENGITDQSIGEAHETIMRLDDYIREQEVYVMAGKLMERLPGTLDFYNVGGTSKADWRWWYKTYKSSCTGRGFDSFESAVKDAYKTLIEEIG